MIENIRELLKEYKGIKHACMHKNKTFSPNWLPEELSFEEKQALEEELAKTLAKQMEIKGG